MLYFKMPFIQAALTSENPYEKKGGLMCLAVLAEGCADHIRTKYVLVSSDKFPIHIIFHPYSLLREV